MRAIAGGFGHTIFDRSRMSIRFGFGLSASFFFFLSQKAGVVRTAKAMTIPTTAAPAFFRIEFSSKLNIAIPSLLVERLVASVAERRVVRLVLRQQARLRRSVRLVACQAVHRHAHFAVVR